jgi:very-short-patch-repair endonuclease
VTRRRLIEGLAAMNTVWSGILDDVDFLSRLYDVEALPSHDPRFATAGRDIFQHRCLNLDWNDDWIFHDPRFGLANDDDALLRFLAEMLHPYVRTDLAEVKRLCEFLNATLIHDGYKIVQIDDISGAPVFVGCRSGSGVQGSMKNIIFAAVGPKPEIVLVDALNNDLRVVKHEQHCLIYDRPLAAHGLTWREVVGWWADREGMDGHPERKIWLSLHNRLLASLGDNGAERRILTAYAKRYRRHGADIPALLPQVYLHYDPYTQTRRRTPGPLPRQRMDFLLLAPHGIRIVIECDGRQHYAETDGRASPQRYAAMMAEDRELRLKGYEVYRFGGAELTDNPTTEQLLDAFFDRLAEHHG